MKNFYEKYLKPYLEDDLTVVCILFLFALILRLSFLPHLVFDPAFVHPVVDCKEHNDLAFEILNLNHWRINKFWYHTPGYAYFVALVYKLLGHSVVRLAVVQYVLGSGGACLLYFMAKKLINRTAGIFAGLFMSVYWQLIYVQSHVYSENLSMALNLLTVYFLIFSSDSWRKYLLSGMLLGASIVVRPEMLPFAGVLWIGLILKKLSFKRFVTYYGLFLVGVAFCVLPLLIRNHQLSGYFLLREQIGVNFFMGSMPQFKGSNIYVSIGNKWEEVISMPYAQQGLEGRGLTEKELNAFYTRQVFDYISAHPFRWTAYMASKVFSVLVGIDFLRTEDVYFYDAYIRSTPLALLQTWAINILALLGAFLALRREPGRFMFLFLFLGSYLPALLFTFKTRYLISLMPLVILLACYALAALVDLLQRRQLKAAVAGICAFALLVGAVRLNPLGIHWPSKSEMYYAIGVNFEYYGDYARAEEYFLKAINADPANVSAINDLGVVNMQTGQYARAAGNFNRVLRLKDGSRYRENYLKALEYAQKGGTYDFMGFFSDEFRDHIYLYHYYFPYPYQGPVYQRSVHDILAGRD